MQSHEFTLMLKNVREETPYLEDLLFESGCDDALIHCRNGGVYLEFSRAALNLEEAIISAIKDVRAASIEFEVASVSPGNLVTEAEIAKRAKVSRQLVSLWIKGERRKHFPSPSLQLTEKTFLWDWSQVVMWLKENKIIRNKEMVENAIFIANINAVLESGDRDKQKKRKILQARIA